MLNKERYEKELEEVLANALAVSKSGKICTCTSALKCDDCMFFNNKCRENAINWLNSEYEGPILTEEEKIYLSNIIKPFKDKVLNIQKKPNVTSSKEWITILLKDYEIISLPYFDKDTMYQNMELGKKYTLEELDL